MSKKTASLILALFFSFFGIKAFASEASNLKLIDIPEKGVSIAVPNTFACFCLSDEDLSEKFQALGMDGAAIVEEMRLSNIYLYAFHPEFNSMINVVVTESESIRSLDDLEDDFILSFFSDDGTETKSTKLVKEDLYKSKGKKYVFSQMDSIENPDLKAIQLTSIEDNQLIIITMTKYNGIKEDEDIQLLKDIVDNSQLAKDENHKPQNSNYYYFKEAGIHFLIPDGWQEKDLLKERQFVRFKMSPLMDGSTETILFSYQDIWSKLPASAKLSLGVLSRKDLDAKLDAELIKMLLDTSEIDVIFEQHSGLKFGIFDYTQTISGLTSTSKTAFTIVDGGVIMFAMYDLNKKYDAVFNEVLDSIFFD